MDVVAFFNHLFTMIKSALDFIFSDVFTIYPFMVVLASVFGVSLLTLVMRFFKGHRG